MSKTWRGCIGIYRPLVILIRPTASKKNCTALSNLPLLVRLNKERFNVTTVLLISIRGGNFRTIRWVLCCQKTAVMNTAYFRHAVNTSV